MNKWLLFIPLLALSCQLFDDDSITSDSAYFVLCEGGFGSSNSTLWTIDDDYSTATGPVHWNPNSNPLGDVAQSMTIFENQLFIVVNNSHTIEIMDITKDGATYNRSIAMTDAGPRYLEVYNNKAYVSCWNLLGIAVIDLESDTFIDTISTIGKPEDLLLIDNMLYVTVPIAADWSNLNQVLEIDLDNQNEITRTFSVLDGPTKFVHYNNALWITNVYYDQLWNSWFGTSSIDLSSGDVITSLYGSSMNYGNDIIVYNDQVVRTYNNGVSPLNSDLTIDTNNIIDGFKGVYSLGTIEDYLILGTTTDYLAPDTVYFIDSDGSTISTLTVGAIPGDFAFYTE
ncbi:MAG: hypothetical protein HQ509_04045 [Candidatus Marinimicrobia bacterium]|nr:hypothetical protein [Candidatus Neomarinimicrobiota bacterium]